MLCVGRIFAVTLSFHPEYRKVIYQEREREIDKTTERVFSSDTYPMGIGGSFPGDKAVGA
jgi:hypothetical protein